MSTVIFGTLKSEYLPPQPGRSGRSDAMIPQRGSAPTEQERGVQQRKIMGGEIRPTPSLKNEYALPTKLQGGHDLKKSIYTSYDELPLLLNVKQLVDLMEVSDSSIYELIQEDDFPSLRIGKGIVPGNDDNQTAIPKNGWQTILSLRPILPGGGRADAAAGQRHRCRVRAEAVPGF